MSSSAVAAAWATKPRPRALRTRFAFAARKYFTRPKTAARALRLARGASPFLPPGGTSEPPRLTCQAQIFCSRNKWNRGRRKSLKCAAEAAEMLDVAAADLVSRKGF